MGQRKLSRGYAPIMFSGVTKCQISMSSLCSDFANEQLDHMELRKMEIVNAKVVFKS